MDNDLYGYLVLGGMALIASGSMYAAAIADRRASTKNSLDAFLKDRFQTNCNVKMSEAFCAREDGKEVKIVPVDVSGNSYLVVMEREREAPIDILRFARVYKPTRTISCV